MSPKKETQKSKGFTDEERAAMKERAKELKAEATSKKDKAAGESDLLEKIAEMSEPDFSMAKRIHTLIKDSTPALSPNPGSGFPRSMRFSPGSPSVTSPKATPRPLSCTGST